jgi:hypothetical protein
VYRITVTVTPERDLAARLRLAQGSRTLYEDWAAASTDPDCAARLGNRSLDPLRPGGHPPLGRYELVARGAPPKGTEAEYGRKLLLFEPVGGQALDAEAYGRLALLVYAGRMAPDSKLRRTQGGLRLSSTAMDFLLVGLGDETPVELRIEIAEPPPWWVFWRKARVHPPLSGRAPEHSVSPTDEATLIAELMKQLRPRHAPQPIDNDGHDRLRERDDRRDSRSSSDDTPQFRGRGGEGGGAGASGGWSDAPAAGRGPGVDAAGRIMAAAGIAAVATAAAMATREEATASGVPSSSTNDETAAASTDSSNSSATESTSSTSESSWSGSSTSY